MVQESGYVPTRIITKTSYSVAFENYHGQWQDDWTSQKAARQQIISLQPRLGFLVSDIVNSKEKPQMEYTVNLV